MRKTNFYVEHARLLSHGLSWLGKSSVPPQITGKETAMTLSGKLIGWGLHSETCQDLTPLLNHAINENSLVRRSAYVGLSCAGWMDPRTEVSEGLCRGFSDPDLEVSKACLFGYGLSQMGMGSSCDTNELEGYLVHDNWKLRAAAGLAQSLIYIGVTDQFTRFVDLLSAESNAYVKVCSSWPVSTAFAMTRNGVSEYDHLLRMGGDDASFFRDMACLGLGYSFLGTRDATVTEMLQQAIRDPHPYVRESACFGIGLTHFGAASDHPMTILKGALNDGSGIVRSGAALALGIVFFNSMGLPVSVSAADESTSWGLAISAGLARTGRQPSLLGDYARWGHHIGNCFRDSIDAADTVADTPLKAFQGPVNDGLKGRKLSNGIAAGFRLSFPGYFHYFVYDSFWWGLWVLAVLGSILMISDRDAAVAP